MKIANNQKVIDFLLDEKKPIEDRLREHNNHECLAFVHSPKYLYRSFAKLFDNNPEYQKAFETAKNEAIKTIHNKRKTLNYEGFLRYLFFELGQTADHWGKQNLATHESKNKNEPFIYNIVPDNQKEAEILERVCIDHIKSTDGKGLAVNGAFRLDKKSETLFIGNNSLELLKQKLETSFKQPHADKKQVVSHFKKRFIEPLKETKTTSLPQRIYRNIKNGIVEPPFLSYYYSYYTTKATVIELIKFEDYLNGIIEKPKTDDSLPETLSNLITHNNSVKIVDAIKV